MAPGLGGGRMGDTGGVATEIERKYLLAQPADLDALRAECGDIEVSDIEQRYLDAPAGVERRVRRELSHGEATHVLTEKRAVAGTNVERIEDERPLDAEEYQLVARDTVGATIRKRRHRFVHDGQAFELDEFIEPIDAWLLEIELSSADQPVGLPPPLEIEREVTDDPAWRNSTIARR